MSARRYGYGRVSTKDQDTEAQREALIAAGIEERFIFVEKASTRLKERPELERLRGQLREGDSLTVTKVDRLARSVLDLIMIADDLQANGVTLEFLSGTFNRDDPMGNAFFQIAGVFAELERELIRQRTLEGLTVAAKNGRRGGRPSTVTPQQVQAAREMLAEVVIVDGKEERKFTQREVAARIGVTPQHLRHLLDPSKNTARNERRKVARNTK